MCLPNGHRKPLISVIYQIAALVVRINGKAEKLELIDNNDKLKELKI